MALFIAGNVTAAVPLNESATFLDLPQDIVSDEVRLWFQAINFAIICEFIDVIGSAANIINIICFCKQGFKDSVNISLLGMYLLTCPKFFLNVFS